MKHFIAILCSALIASCATQLARTNEAAKRLAEGGASLNEAIEPAPAKIRNAARSADMASYMGRAMGATASSKSKGANWENPLNIGNFTCSPYNKYYSNLYRAAVGKEYSRHLKDDFKPSSKTGYDLLFAAMFSSVEAPKVEYNQFTDADAGRTAEALCRKALEEGIAGIPDAGAGDVVKITVGAIKAIANAFEKTAELIGREVDSAKKLEALREFILAKETSEYFRKAIAATNQDFDTALKSQVAIAAFELRLQQIRHNAEHASWKAALKDGVSELERVSAVEQAFSKRFEAIKKDVEKFDKAYAESLTNPLPAILDEYENLREMAEKPEIKFEDLVAAFKAIKEVVEAAKDGFEGAEPAVQELIDAT